MVQLDNEQDFAWECIQISYTKLLKTLDNCRDDHLALERKATSLPKPNIFNGKSSVFPAEQDPNFLPEAVHFVHNVTEQLSINFPELWKLGQAYFKGDLIVDPDGGKSAVFKEMILGGIR